MTGERGWRSACAGWSGKLGGNGEFGRGDGLLGCMGGSGGVGGAEWRRCDGGGRCGGLRWGSRVVAVGEQVAADRCRRAAAIRTVSGAVGVAGTAGWRWVVRER